MWKAKVKWNGNHYFKDQEVKGSNLTVHADGRLDLFDDEEYYMIINGHSIELTRNEWVEIQPETLESTLSSMSYDELVASLPSNIKNNPYWELIEISLKGVKEFEKKKCCVKPIPLSEEDRGLFRIQYDHSCSCEEYIPRGYKYCPYCGKLIDWDALPADKTI